MRGIRESRNRESRERVREETEVREREREGVSDAGHCARAFVILETI